MNSTREKVMKLRAEGATYREIMDRLGLRSLASVSYHLKHEHDHSLYLWDKRQQVYKCRGCEAKFKRLGGKRK